MPSKKLLHASAAFGLCFAALICSTTANAQVLNALTSNILCETKLLNLDTPVVVAETGQTCSQGRKRVYAYGTVWSAKIDATQNIVVGSDWMASATYDRNSLSTTVQFTRPFQATPVCSVTVADIPSVGLVTLPRISATSQQSLSYVAVTEKTNLGGGEPLPVNIQCSMQ